MGEQLVALDDSRPENFASVPHQPECAPGLASTENVDNHLADLVANALASQGWAGADRKLIKVQECSGRGGSRTYKVSCKGCAPEAVALHLRSEITAIEPLAELRMKEAAELFSEHGFAPRRLVSGGDWFIDVWEGTGFPKFDSAEAFTELGQLLGRIHQLPVDWFDGWREKLRDRSPELRDVAEGSHVWFFSARKDMLGNMPERVRSCFLLDPFFAPTTDVAKRIVTSHCDLHPGNMLQTDRGIMCIDFEFTCVTFAAQDLGFVFLWADSGEKKRAFLDAYLRETGLLAGPADVDAVYLDAEIQCLGSHSGPLAPWDPGDYILRFGYFKAVVERLRGNPSMQAEILGGSSFCALLDTNEELMALKVPICESLLARLPWLPDADPQASPIMQVPGVGACESFNLKASGFSVSFCFHLQEFQRYAHREAAVVSTTVHGPNRSIGDCYVGLCGSKLAFYLNGNVAAPGEDTVDDGKALVFHAEVFDGKWHHCTISYDSTEKEVTLYIDGQLVETHCYLAAWPVRVTDLTVGCAAQVSVPMPSDSGASPQQSAGNLLAIRVIGHAMDLYDGVYVQQPGLVCGKPCFKNAHGRFLKKYDSDGDGSDWSFDHREPDPKCDWCDGGFYHARPGADLLLGTYKWSKAGLLDVSWGEVPAVADDPSSFHAEAGAKVFDARYNFPEGQLAQVAIFSRRLGEQEPRELYERELTLISNLETRPRPPAPELQKVDLEKPLTWGEHRLLAEELGGVLPTQLDIILASVHAGAVDAWVPVRRDDGREDWVQTGSNHPHPIYISHLDCFGAPSWGDNNEAAAGRPMYFYMLTPGAQI